MSEIIFTQDKWKVVERTIKYLVCPHCDAFFPLPFPEASLVFRCLSCPNCNHTGNYIKSEK